MATKPLKKRIQGQAYSIVGWQLVGVLVFALLALCFSVETGIATLAGGLAYALPTLAFVFGVFRFAGATQMNQFVIWFFFGEMTKLLLSGILFLMIVKTLPVSLSSVLAGFVGAIVSFWVVSFWRFSRIECME